MSFSLEKHYVKIPLVVFLLLAELAVLIVLGAYFGGAPQVPRFVSADCADQSQCPLKLSGTREAFYEYLDTDEADNYAIELEQGQQFRAKLIVPDKILTVVRDPVVDVSGPGIKKLEFNEGQRDPVNNSAALKNWLSVQDIVFQAPASGTYNLAVYDQVGEAGVYGLLFAGNDPVHLSEIWHMVIGFVRLNL
ncbi:MAG: hypothetical protein ABIG32_00280 [Candidatus Uhrbacteria bacterium]|nr:hypothetical protein [Patescibacteria group bacterium]MBU1906760.1 hypothetical protein [Patescibacteria group bacterium]